MLERHFARLARYNAWANRRLHAACAALGDAEYRRARPAFFGSIHGTLNHLLLADGVWLARIEGRAHPRLPLDAELHPDLPSLTTARAATDAAVTALVDRLDGAALAREVAYRNSSGREFTDDVGTILAHLFNHQTHHRGQVHDMLVATPVPPPPLDLIFFVREGEPQA